MTKTQKFEEACKAIKERDGIEARLYQLQGRKRDKAVTLNHPYRNIALKYLCFEDIKGTASACIFSWQQVTDACVLADIYVTSVVRKQYSSRPI